MCFLRAPFFLGGGGGGFKMDPKPIPTPQAISVGTGCCKAAAETLAKAPLPPLEASCSACRQSLGGECRLWEPQVESGCCEAARSISRNLFSRSLKGASCLLLHQR